MSTLQEIVCRITGAGSCREGDVIQSLWSGYGVIQRVKLDLSEWPAAIVKHIDISSSRENRRGWSGDVSHQRKIRSYQIEKTFYERYSRRSSADCRIPALIAATEKSDDSGWVLVLEDLDAAGFALRKSRVDQNDIYDCLRWLAEFHATFMNCEPEGLWPIGTYWHLETRPDEWLAMERGPLRDVASKIDAKLNSARFQTLVHGDAKLANFCFSDKDTTRSGEVGGAGEKSRVAAVDFQYVGGGCGMKDVAYLISSCLNDKESARQQDTLLECYFSALKQSLTVHHPEVEFDDLEQEWRELYPFAWADFCRFLAGWSPGHWKMNEYNDRITQAVVDQLR